MATPKTPSMRAARFADLATNPARALQTWLILIGCARRRQSIRQGDLARQLGYKGTGHAFGPMLGHLERYCAHAGLPCLAAIVVTGKGDPRLALDDALGPAHRAQEAVFSFDWYAVAPPTVEQLAEAWSAK